MGFHGILVYTLRAVVFASVGTFLYVLSMKNRGVRPTARQIARLGRLIAALFPARPRQDTDGQAASKKTVPGS